jgi:hypothetical protein
MYIFGWVTIINCYDLLGLVCWLQHLLLLYLFSFVPVSLPWSSTIFQSIKFQILKAFIIKFVEDLLIFELIVNYIGIYFVWMYLFKLVQIFDLVSTFSWCLITWLFMYIGSFSWYWN